MKKQKTWEIQRKIEEYLKTMELLVKDRDLPLGRQEREIAGEIIHKLRQTAGGFKKINLHLNILEMYLGETDIFLGKEGIESVTRTINALKQDAYELDG